MAFLPDSLGGGGVDLEQIPDMPESWDMVLIVLVSVETSFIVQ